MFIDASAIVAILTREADAEAMVRDIENDPHPITSPMAVFETVLAICRKRQRPVPDAQAEVANFLSTAGIRLVPITPADSEVALDAFARYGKGQGHPAQLNMGDCFAYAVARSYGTGILYKGDDFARTDAGRTNDFH
jgi:ribonuclease VapC